jgi:hypothetical protein
MTGALALIGGDIIASLRALVEQPAVDRAVAERAADVARALADAGVRAQVVRRGPGDYEVVASTPGLFAREHGSLKEPPRPVVQPALDKIARRVP